MTIETDTLAFAGRIQAMLDEGNPNGGRASVEALATRASDNSVRVLTVAALVSSLPVAEVILGVCSRADLSASRRWRLVAAALSRDDITVERPARIAILSLAAKALAEHTSQPSLPALCAPLILRRCIENLSDAATDLLAEQTLDFISTHRIALARYRFPKLLLQAFCKLAEKRAISIDDPDLRSEWQHGTNEFVREATATSDGALDGQLASELSDISSWMFASESASDLFGRAKKQFERSLLSALTTISSDEHTGLTVSVRVNGTSSNLSWGQLADVIDRIERFVQELADLSFRTLRNPIQFSPQHAAPGSWTIVLKAKAPSDCALSIITALQNADVRSKWSEALSGLPSADVQAVFLDDGTLTDVALEDGHDAAGPLDDSKPRVRSYDVPQADNLTRVTHLVRIAVAHPDRFEARTKFLDEGQVTPRQYSYYVRAAVILGLLDDRLHPTGIGRVIARAPARALAPLLEAQFLASNVGAAWALWTNVSSARELDENTAADFLLACAPSLSEATAHRRAATLRAWVELFRNGWGLFE